MTDKNKEYMMSMWGTEYLVSEYGWEEKIKKQKMLREINHDDATPKEYDSYVQSELYAKNYNQVNNKNINSIFG